MPSPDLDKLKEELRLFERLSGANSRALIAEIERLRGEVAAAKAIGAAEMCDEIKAEHLAATGEFDADGLAHYLSMTAMEKRTRAFELRKELA
jgi:hypothetical protein